MNEASHALYCVSGSKPDEIRKKLSLFGTSEKKLQELAKHSLKNFSFEAPFRLVLCLEKNSDLNALREKTLEILSGEKETFQENIFFGLGKSSGKIAFLFPGQGSQYPGMGKDLSEIFPGMKEILHSADEAFRLNAAPHRKTKALSASLYPEEGKTRETEETLRSTDLAQCAIGCISLGMAEILENFGIKPDALCGHSYGELPALCRAGVFSLPDCLALSVLRGKFMAGNPENPKGRGGMMAVRADVATIREVLEKEKPDVVLANENSPSQCVLSGSHEALDHAADILKPYKIRGVRLPVSAAFHSPLVEDAALPFRQILETVSFGKPAIPVMSNAKGSFYPEKPEEIRRILASQLLSPVRFIQNIEGLFDAGIRTFIEVGPKNILTGLASSILEGRQGVRCMAMDASSGKNPGKKDLFLLLAQLAALGYPLSRQAFF